MEPAGHINRPNLFLVAFGLACGLLPPQLAANAETRGESKGAVVIDLPKHSIGSLERIIDGDDYSDEHSPGTTFSELSGRVAVAPNTILGVTIRDSLSDPIPVFARIPANLVQSITLTGLANFDERTVKSILRFKNLKRLQLDRAELDDKGLGMLAALPNLESIVASHTQIKGTTLPSLCILKKLSRLDIGSNELKGESLTALTCLKHLDNLSIGRCHLRNPHLSFLTELPQLTHLELSDNNLLSDPCLKYISRLKNLTNIKIDGTHISPKATLLLKGAPLRFLKVSPNFYSPSEKAMVQKAFPRVKVKVNDKQSRNFGIFKELFEKDK